MSKKVVALLGATSHLAKNLLVQNQCRQAWDIVSFGRNPIAISSFASSQGFSAEAISLETFPHWNGMCDALINCVGFGTPGKVRQAGRELFTTAEAIDDEILRYLDRHPKTTYINFSSGAVYGTALNAPINVGAQTTLELDPIKEVDFYRISKIHQEAKHRSCTGMNIVDIRLFSFFSQFIDQSAGYLLTDVLHSLRTRMPLQTSSLEIHRDYISPFDLFSFVDGVISAGSLNLALDTFSAGSISKSALLDALTEDFGLRVDVSESDIPSPTGHKPYYYSNDKRAADVIGYQPAHTSWNGIRLELELMGFPPKS